MFHLRRIGLIERVTDPTFVHRAFNDYIGNSVLALIVFSFISVYIIILLIEGPAFHTEDWAEYVGACESAIDNYPAGHEENYACEAGRVVNQSFIVATARLALSRKPAVLLEIRQGANAGQKHSCRLILSFKTSIQ
jgi:hypothetical protein